MRCTEKRKEKRLYKISKRNDFYTLRGGIIKLLLRETKATYIYRHRIIVASRQLSHPRERLLLLLLCARYTRGNIKGVVR